jgi:TfoX/Sxy family transcriptional regulator of competence genes
MAYSTEFADRIRTALAGTSPVREVTMFGGLAFMVNDAMVACVRGDGGLLVRADPARADELLEREGARHAEMGSGRRMGEGWITVDDEVVATDDGLGFWLDVALEHNRK